MKRTKIKIKANPYAELMADEYGESIKERLITTPHGDFFLGLIREAVRGGKFSYPSEVVEFCYMVADLAHDKLLVDDVLAIMAPPQSAIARKVAKAVKADD